MKKTAHGVLFRSDDRTGGAGLHGRRSMAARTDCEFANQETFAVGAPALPHGMDRRRRTDPWPDLERAQRQQPAPHAHHGLAARRFTAVGLYLDGRVDHLSRAAPVS